MLYNSQRLVPFPRSFKVQIGETIRQNDSEGGIFKQTLKPVIRVRVGVKVRGRGGLLKEVCTLTSSERAPQPWCTRVPVYIEDQYPASVHLAAVGGVQSSLIQPH